MMYFTTPSGSGGNGILQCEMIDRQQEWHDCWNSSPILKMVRHNLTIAGRCSILTCTWGPRCHGLSSHNSQIPRVFPRSQCVLSGDKYWDHVTVTQHIHNGVISRGLFWKCQQTTWMSRFLPIENRMVVELCEKWKTILKNQSIKSLFSHMSKCNVFLKCCDWSLSEYHYTNEVFGWKDE
jgi:hypothetical protein